MHTPFEPAKKASGPLSMDGRLKLMALAIVLVLVLSSGGFTFPLMVIALSMLVPLATRVSWKLMALRILEPAVIVVVLIALKSLSGDELLYVVPLFGHPVSIYHDGLMEGLELAVRIIAALGATAAMSLSTPFAEFLGALSWLRVPGPFVEISLFAYRYMRNLFEDAQVIYNSQKIRLGYSSPRRALASMGTLAGSLVIKAFDQAEATAASLHQRGYDGTIPTYNRKPFRRDESLATLAFVAVMAGLWVLLGMIRG